MVEVLKAGGLVIYPTETLYGLGVVMGESRLAHTEPMEKIWKFKERERNKPVLMAVTGEVMAKKYVKLTKLGTKVIRKYWPGPVSILCESKQDKNVKIGLRCPDNEMMLEVISRVGRPISSTSVNLSGEAPIRSLADFYKKITLDRQRMVDLFVDIGELPVSMPSTLVDTTGEELKVVRQGAVEVGI